MTTSPSNITDAAVSIALAALPAEACVRVGFDDMRAALEAAAPYLMAEAWEVGMVSMYASTGGEWPLIPEQNPYRTTR